MSEATCSSKCTQSQTCSFLTEVRMPKFTWRFFAVFVTARNSAPCVWRTFISAACCFLMIVLHRRQSWPSNLVREKTIVLFVSDHLTILVSLYLFVMTETTRVSLRTMSMSLTLKILSHFPLNMKCLSSVTLGDCSSFHNFAPDSEVSSSHHLINTKFYRRLQS